MEGLPVELTDLPDEILLLILKKLDNTKVLYSFIGVNKLVHDSIFTNRLTVARCFSDDGPWPQSNNQILDQFCLQILPTIHHRIEWLNVEPSSLERILLCTNYPNLCGLGLYNLEKKIALRIFTDKKFFSQSLIVQKYK
ncbi:unnamed protein product [Rotaria magnacalcarata]|uniref:F-box domain-containing protein n=1 Tax=Rotaria magnacalcarata TaxID=392030 RepID=A0A816RXJ4_9BILA|nr:unnamed protein product [Rotaria magnacalcarata]CAF2211644.1 unnamed protein product [Rotaria magnacalcarata]